MSWKCGRDRSRPGQFSLTRQGISLDVVAPSREMGIGHFCRPLHVAMQSGLSLRTDLAVRSSGVKSLRIPHRLSFDAVFPADYLHPGIVTAASAASSPGYSDVPAYGQILLRQRDVTLGPFFLLLPISRGPARFRLALHVAMQIGLSHPFLSRAWRTVSEDFRIAPDLSC